MLQHESTTTSGVTVCTAGTAHFHTGELPNNLPSIGPAGSESILDEVDIFETAATDVNGKLVRGYTFHIDMLRGVKISKTLKRFGYVWRVRPTDVDTAGKTAMYNLSQVVPHLDFFLSHSWRSSGIMKYISLLVHFNWSRAVTGGMMSIGVVFVLEAHDILPTFQKFTYQGSYLDNHWKGDIPWGHWCTVVCPLFALLSLLSSPYLPMKDQGEPSVFLDQVCIHQVDAEMKKLGIYSLAGFLQHTKTMIILWTPPYFSRLWCVFELAAFWRIHRANVAFRPIFLESALFVCYMIVWMTSLVLNFGTPGAVERGSTVQTFIAIALCGFVPASVALPVIRSFMRHKRELDSQISRFDCHTADAFAKDDMTWIFQRINLWYGSPDRFNRVVRHDLRRMIRERVRNYHVPYTSVLPVVFPFICHLMDILSGLVVANAPLRVILLFVVRMLVSWLFVVPNVIFIYFFLAELFSRKFHCIVEVLINISITLLISGICAGGLYFYTAAFEERLGLKSNILVLIGWMLVTWICFFRHYKIRRSVKDGRLLRLTIHSNSSAASDGSRASNDTTGKADPPGGLDIQPAPDQVGRPVSTVQEEDEMFEGEETEVATASRKTLNQYSQALLAQAETKDEEEWAAAETTAGKSEETKFWGTTRIGHAFYEAPSSPRETLPAKLLLVDTLPSPDAGSIRFEESPVTIPASVPDVTLLMRRS